MFLNVLGKNSFSFPLQCLKEEVTTSFRGLCHLPYITPASVSLIPLHLSSSAPPPSLLEGPLWLYKPIQIRQNNFTISSSLMTSAKYLLTCNIHRFLVLRHGHFWRAIILSTTDIYNSVKYKSSSLPFKVSKW